MHVQIVLFDGFDLLDALAPYEVFCAAAMYSGDAVSAELVTAEGARAVTSGTGGLSIQAAGKLDPDKGGIILVPGASGNVEGDGPDSVPAILARAAESELTGLIRQAIGRPDVVVATVCGGSLLLAMGGLLENRHAVTHHLGMDALQATGAIPVAARVVDDDSLVTGGGVTSGLDVALYLVERELGSRVAIAVEKLFEYERRGTVWRSVGLASSSPVSPPAEAAEQAAETHLSDPVPEACTAPSDASDFAGVWDTLISTPIGKMSVRLHITSINGRITGTATQGDDVADMENPYVENGRLIWTQRVTKPMRLNLRFEVTVQGRVMSGFAKAGMLPASKLSGAKLTE
ncbi:DJ-1/PfpI family protein [Paenibacillus ginsengarvi]|uniref:DJ-1/PfpI family protein n=1 Tax=Paenibacillus ginsengarvi TaxID=400777 RepID=A0A3B0BXI7_9BACL|nr:DJ-1/PfpI family protein [Paenibacillus ginsengarvi]RKN77118.1 DJ-1/PfpI family protein [Paenibacillus ginsengarvi]